MNHFAPGKPCRLEALLDIATGVFLQSLAEIWAMQFMISATISEPTDSSSSQSCTAPRHVDFLDELVWQNCFEKADGKYRQVFTQT
jgi:hypothetical protein